MHASTAVTQDAESEIVFYVSRELGDQHLAVLLETAGVRKGVWREFLQKLLT